MKCSYHVAKSERKAMVRVIGETIGMTPVYQGVPTCAYVIGDISVNANCELVWDERTDAALIDRIKTALATAGFTAEAENTETEEETDTDAADEGGLTVSMPRDFFTDETLANLQKIVSSKRTLLMKALGVDDLPILITDEAVSFPWFPEPSPAEAKAFTNLIIAICRMAKEAKRVTATEKTTESEKYTFRCWLLRLGFGGAEHKHDRAILLQNLFGHAAFKNQADADAFYQKLKEKKAAQKAAAQEAEDGEEATVILR